MCIITVRSIAISHQWEEVSFSDWLLCLIDRACLESMRRCTWACPVCWTAPAWTAWSTWHWTMRRSASSRRAATLSGASRRTWRTCRVMLLCNHTYVPPPHTPQSNFKNQRSHSELHSCPDWVVTLPPLHTHTHTHTHTHWRTHKSTRWPSLMMPCCPWSCCWCRVDAFGHPVTSSEARAMGGNI